MNINAWFYYAFANCEDKQKRVETFNANMVLLYEKDQVDDGFDKWVMTVIERIEARTKDRKAVCNFIRTISNDKFKD